MRQTDKTNCQTDKLTRQTDKLSVTTLECPDLEGEARDVLPLEDPDGLQDLLCVQSRLIVVHLRRHHVPDPRAAAANYHYLFSYY